MTAARTALHSTYTLETPDGPRTLAVHLLADEGNVGSSELLPILHQAVDAWNGQYPDVFVDVDLTFEPPDGSIRAILADYLYADGSVNGERLGRHLSLLLERGQLHTFTLRPGAPAEGPDLVGRGATVETLCEQLKSSSVHLMAPRRYGKTSVLWQLKRSLARECAICLYLEVSPGLSASWLVAALVEEAMENAKCRKALEGLPELAGWPAPRSGYAQRNLAGRQLTERLGAGIWSFGHRLFEGLGAVGTVLLIDEFSVFLRRALERSHDETVALLDLLTRSRTSETPTRQVLAGSAGLSTYVHFHGLDRAFAGLCEVQLLPLDRRDAAVLVEELLYGEQQLPSPEVIDEVLEDIGEPIPYFLHALIQAAGEEEGEGQAIDRDRVNRAYRETLLGPRGNVHFREYQIAHQPYPGKFRRAASRLLAEMARKPEGVEGECLKEVFAGVIPDSGKLEPLLSCLREDYDLVERDGRWKMRSKVLRDRWSQGEPWLTGEDNVS